MQEIKNAYMPSYLPNNATEEEIKTAVGKLMLELNYHLNLLHKRVGELRVMLENANITVDGVRIDIDYSPPQQEE